MNKSQIKQMTEEFEAHVGLSPTEARRSVFIALAAARRWNNAQIGRYLGVHRMRVSQKLEKYKGYVASGKMPLLTQVMESITPGPEITSLAPVAFEQSDWEDKEFALGMIDLVSSDLEPSAQAA